MVRRGRSTLDTNKVWTLPVRDATRRWRERLHCCESKKIVEVDLIYGAYCDVAQRSDFMQTFIVG
jgi:hypothetical protein